MPPGKRTSLEGEEKIFEEINHIPKLITGWSSLIDVDRNLICVSPLRLKPV